MTRLQHLREQFWFLPAALCVAAFVVAEGLIALEEALDEASAPAWAGALLYRVG